MDETITTLMEMRLRLTKNPNWTDESDEAKYDPPVRYKVITRLKGILFM